MILDGKKISEKILEDIKLQIKKINKKITIAIIWIGNDPSSETYVNNKIKKSKELGIETRLFHFENNIKEEMILNLIDELNNNKNINGIILQSPVPNNININNCFNKISYQKDIDGFSNISVGNLSMNNPSFIPCTSKGILRLLDCYDIDLNGKNVCIINRSNIVGKPLVNLLLERNATITVCHSKTKNIKKITKASDIVISAVGIPNFITCDMIKKNAVVIDVGINRINGNIVGDVDFEKVSKKVSYITPVPGGVGPMTVAMIFENVLDAINIK